MNLFLSGRQAFSLECLLLLFNLEAASKSLTLLRLFGDQSFDLQSRPIYSIGNKVVTVRLERRTALPMPVKIRAFAHDSNHFPTLKGEVQKATLFIALEDGTNCRSSRFGGVLQNWHIQNDTSQQTPAEFTGRLPGGRGPTLRDAQ